MPKHLTKMSFFAASSALALSLATPALARDLKVTVTIKPIHALAAAVMEGKGSPRLLVTGAASPHTYQMKPSDAKSLNDADIVFRVSEAIEPFTAKIVKGLPKSVRVATLAETPGLTLLDVRTGNTFEKHVDDDHDDHKGHADHKDHDDHDHEAGARDGHIWLDPDNARKITAEIARVLSEASPEDAATFKANADRTIADITALEAEIATDLAPARGKPFVVFHDAYQYFERRFGLDAVGSITVSPEVQPSAKRLSEIRAKLSSLSAACVFAEPQFQPKLVSAVIEGTKARAGTLDPEGALLEPGPGAYRALMKALATGLATCLNQGS